MNDPKMSVRQAATWAIARLGGKHAIPHIIERLEKDPIPLVRIEAVKRLGKIKDESVIFPLLQTSAKDDNQNVKSLATYALDELDDSIKIRVYFKTIHSDDPLIRSATLSKIAKIKSPAAFSIIEKVYFESKETPQVQAMACECFGLMSDKRAIPILQKALGENPIVAYSAIRALASLLGNEEKNILISLLSDPKLPEMSKQVILQFILKKLTEDQIFLDVELSKLIIGLLSSDHLNISYMSARILGTSRDLSAIVPLLESSHNAKDPELKRKCYDAIGQILAGNFVPLIKLLKQPFIKSEIKEKILQCMLTFQCHEKFKLPTVVALLQYYSASEESLEWRIQIVSLLSNIVETSSNVLLQALYQVRWPDFIVKDILFILDGKIKENDSENPFLNATALHPLLKSLDPEIKMLAIRLIEKIGQAKSIPLLVSLYYDEKEDKVKQYTKSAIRSIVQGRTT